jgi:hypothetical protein
MCNVTVQADVTVDLVVEGSRKDAIELTKKAKHVLLFDLP